LVIVGDVLVLLGTTIRVVGSLYKPRDSCAFAVGIGQLS